MGWNYLEEISVLEKKWGLNLNEGNTACALKQSTLSFHIFVTGHNQSIYT